MRTNAKNIHRVNANASSPKNVSGAAVGAFFSITASTVPQRVKAVPADRSIPPEMMMIVIPKAGTAMSAALFIITRKFRVERNCPCPQYFSATAKKTSMATNAKRGQISKATFSAFFRLTRVGMILFSHSILYRSEEVATDMMLSSVQSEASRISLNRPRAITPIRSQTDSSSGR